MADFALPVLVVTAAALLGRAGLAHVANRAALGTVLDRQALLPRPTRALVAVALGPVELALGAALVAALVTDRATAVVGTTVVGLGAAFVVLLLALARIRPAAPCGCSGAADGPEGGVGPLDGLRAGVVLAGGLALAGGAAGRLAGLDGAEAATVLVAGLALAAVIDLAARAQPSPSSRSGMRVGLGTGEGA